MAAICRMGKEKLVNSIHIIKIMNYKKYTKAELISKLQNINKETNEKISNSSTKSV